MIKKCPRCREEIQSDAKKCKYCQADLRNWFVRHKFLTVILALIVIAVVGGAGSGVSKNPNTFSSGNSKQQEVTKEEAIKITARTLFAEYEANAIQADEKYKDKVLEVSGAIENIGKDILENPYITLKTDNIISTVQCMLADSEKGKASQLQKGENVILEGTGNGKMINVLLRNCIIK